MCQEARSYNDKGKQDLDEINTADMILADDRLSSYGSQLARLQTAVLHRGESGARVNRGMRCKTEWPQAVTV